MTDAWARTWRRAWLGWAAVTLCVAAVLWSLAAVLLLVVTSATLVALTLGLIRSGTAQREEKLCLRALAVDGLRWGLVATAIAVVSLVQVGLGLLVLVAFVAGSPVVVRRFLGVGGGSGRRPTSREVADALHELDLRRAREAVDRLDLAGLCWAWSRSAELLVEVPHTGARAAVVALRGLYLDEMERRDPVGFASWLGAGAGSSGSPERFLSGPDDPGSGDVAA